MGTLTVTGNGKTRAPRAPRGEPKEPKGRKAEEAAEDFASAVKATAEASGLLASVVRRFVTARAGENFEEKARECEQLSLLFDEIGE